MPKQSNLDHFLIHLVAILFTFSSIIASFLGYGVYQNNKNALENPLAPIKVSAAGTGDSFDQNDFGGGTSSSVYVIPWFSSGSWNKYTSATNITTYTDSGYTKIKSTAPGAQFISSIFDNGTQYMSMWFGQAGEGTLSVRGADSTSALNSASWKPQSSCLPYRYIQFKVDFGAADQTLEELFMSTPTVSISGTVKDAATGKGITGATVKANNYSVTTALNPSTLIRTVYAAGGPGGPIPPGTYSVSWAHKNSNPNSYQIVASKSGYNSQTKTVSINPSSCTFIKTVDFSLIKPSSSSESTSTSSSSSSSGPTSTSSNNETIVKLSEFRKIKLPSIFLAKGSATTNLAKVTDHKKIKNFTLDVLEKNKIVFKEVLDLSSEKTVAALKKLDKYVLMNQVGTVSLNSSILSALNKKATLTMSNLKDVFTPEILVDGKKDTKGIISNISYQDKDGVLTFDVNHFTQFTAAPKLELLLSTGAVTQQNPIIRGRISDPNATITGRFNEVNLAPIKPDKKTGEFTISNLVFKEGDNFLTLEAKSKLGKVLPLVKTLNYSPAAAAPTPISKGLTNYAVITTVLIGALAFLVLLGYLVYRRKKHFSQIPAT